MMKGITVRLILTSVIALCAYFPSWAQGFSENALLFSRTGVTGSARVQALGGANISLGGDYSSALSNPAGLGMYNRSEFTFSPAITTLGAKSDYLGSNSIDSKSTFNIPGLSLALHNETGKESGILGGTFGVSFSRINDLNLNYFYQGQTSGTSIIDYFKDYANGFDPNSLYTDGDNFYNLAALGFNNYLIDTDPDAPVDNTYLSPLDPLNGETRALTQREQITRTGAQYQWSIAYGANVSDKFFFGGSIGLTTLRYKLTQSFRESGFTFSDDPSYNPLDNLSVDESLELRGNGVNVTVGAIYRPLNMFQVGVSYVSPTYYQISDTYNASVSTRWNGFDYFGDGSEILNSVEQGFGEPLISKYSLRTPGKISAGATFIAGKYGFITADVDYTNYSNAKYRSSDIDFTTDNDESKANYTGTFNYRAGVEGRFDVWRLRLGYNVMQDPYTVSSSTNRSIQTFSTGVGIRQDSFFIDLTYALSKTENSRVPYSVSGFADNAAAIKLTRSNIMMTVGFTF